MKLRYTNRAKDDLELAYVWYERQCKGLVDDFLNCIEASIQFKKSSTRPLHCLSYHT